MVDKAALVFAVLLPACGGGPSACPFETPSPIDPRLYLLDGTTGIHADGTVVAHHGLQGGFHIFMAVQSTALYPGDLDAQAADCADTTAPCVDISVEDVTAGRVIDAFAPLGVPLDCQSHRSEPRLVFLDIDSLADVDGHTLRIQASATDILGTHVDTDLMVTCVADMMSP